MRNCRICFKSDTNTAIRNINLYVLGSEGLDICHDCEMEIASHIRSMITLASRARCIAYKAAKQIAEAKLQSTQ